MIAPLETIWKALKKSDRRSDRFVLRKNDL